jgi:lysophospholipase L1-like esterase
MSTEVELGPEITFLIDFNLHWVPAALGLDVPPAAAAAMFNITEAEFLAYASQVEAEVNRIAASFLTQPDLAQIIDGWSIPTGGKVMAIGDSITTYRYSYARLLAAMLAQHRPADKIQVVNVAQSGYTSTHGLENTYTQFLAQQPDWVFIMFGVNDCKKFGSPPAKTLVSIEEYRANLAGMVKGFVRHTSARPVLLTPAPVVEDLVNENPDFAAMRMIWDNADIGTCAAAIHDLARQHQLPVVDLFDAFGSSPQPALYLADGLHPNALGQQLILKQVLQEVGTTKARD